MGLQFYTDYGFSSDAQHCGNNERQRPDIRYGKSFNLFFCHCTNFYHPGRAKSTPLVCYKINHPPQIDGRLRRTIKSKLEIQPELVKYNTMVNIPLPIFVKP